jgi:hypothetical protein
MHIPRGRFGYIPKFFLCMCVCLVATLFLAVDSLQSSPQRAAHPPVAVDRAEVVIPGPLEPFLRMAGISNQVSPDQVLPLLARNIVIYGYGGRLEKNPKPTEFLRLLKGYVQFARVVRLYAGASHAISVTNCREASQFLAIIGYRLMQGCGPNAELEVADPKRAFLANDSGFPLADLEQALRDGKPFTYPYPSTPVPVIFTAQDWKRVQKRHDANASLIDALLSDPLEARLYWAFSRIDGQTREFLRRSPGLAKLLPYEAPLDFYGASLWIRSGRVVVPGGTAAEPAWKQLVGAPPESPAEFVLKLLSRDDGWLAAYFDVLSRLHASQLSYFTDARRLGLFYQALRGSDSRPGPDQIVVFRPNPGLSLLTDRLDFDSEHEPLIPGGVPVWKEIVRHRPASKIASEWAPRAARWKTPQQVVTGMFGLSRMQTDGPLQIFLLLSEIDRERPRNQRLSPRTVRLLADNYEKFSNQYRVFSEFHELTDASIARFLTVAQELDHIRDQNNRANAIGIFQADIGLWKIFARQGQIPSANLNGSWQDLLASFMHVSSPPQIFDAGRAALTSIVGSVTGRPDFSEDELIGLLAGPTQSNPEGRRVRVMLANRIRGLMESQRLASLDTLFRLGDGLRQLSAGNTTAEALVPLANELRGFEMPRPILTKSERNAWDGGHYDNRQTELKTGRDLIQIIRSPHSSQEAADARGQLAPFLKDTLVGLNYAYYEPPGGQMLQDNPLFVRYHDFQGLTVVSGDPAWRTPVLMGRGWAAGGGAHLVGSLADLPYVLAEAEQDFIVPRNVQALVWEDLVPSLLTSAVVPRWWRVTPIELHAVALYQRAGEELLSASAANPDLRQRVLNILSDLLLPQTRDRIENALRSGAVDDALARVTPAQIAYLTAEFRRRYPGTGSFWGPSGKELQSLAARYPDQVSWQRISSDFGVPHPAIAQTYSCELLNVKPFPAITGYSSQLMAESWESNNLYWGRLADELGYSPVDLNYLVPELTRRMIENIFATHFEDWQALLRAMRETGEEFREGKIAPLPRSAVASVP